MALPIPPGPNQPIPNNPFYYPPSNRIEGGDQGVLVVGAGLTVSPDGVISATGTGGVAVTSLTPSIGLAVDNTTGNIIITNTGVVSLNAGPGIGITSSGSGAYTITNTLPSTPTAGTVTQVNTGTGLTGGPITGTGTISLTDTGVAAATYTNPTITVDAQGRITFAAPGPGGSGVSGSYPIQIAGGSLISIAASTTANPGAVQLTDSVSSTSVTTAATPKAVKTANDNATAASVAAALADSKATAAGLTANNALPKSGGTMTGLIAFAPGQTFPGTSGVTQIVAGTNITVTPAGGTGVVTIDATGGAAPVPATPAVEGVVFGCTDSTNFNYGLGDGILGALTTGTLNIAIGTGALATTDSGTSNTAVGIGALFSNTSGTQNVALGQQALFSATTAGLNTAIGSQSLQNTTGDANTALGNFAGNVLTTGSSNILIGNQAGGAGAGALDTGSNNVVIGNCVSVVSNTGDCQLAIGVNTICWLTGTSTGAIKPGAGIIDCANSCGTVGQALLSTGSNQVVWGSAGVPSWTNGGTVTSKVTGTTTNPSPGNVGYNTVYYRQLGAKEYEVVYRFNQSAPGAAGSGDYLFALPASLQFDTTLQFQVAISFAGPNTAWWTWALPGPALSHVTDGTNATLVAQPLIYDATRFRLVGPTGGTFTATTVNAMGSGFFPFSTFGLSFTIRFQFTSA